MGNQIEKLCGVDHGGLDIDMSGNQRLPSKELYRELISLGAGARVGIEYCPVFDSPFTVAGIEGEFKISEQSKFYWRRLKRILTSAGLTVVMLEDFPAYLESSRRLDLIAELEGSYYKRVIKGNKITNEEQAEYIRELYRLNTESDYFFVVRREEELIRNIRANSLQAVVLGLYHAGFLYSRQSESGIAVKHFFVDQPFLLKKQRGFYFSEEDAPKRNLFFEELAPGIIYPSLANEINRCLLEKDLIERRYRALKEGRVTTETRPLFVGTWDTAITERGLFEVILFDGENIDLVRARIKSGREVAFEGIIEDCLGTAGFIGLACKGKVGFSKRYEDGSCSKDAYLCGELLYSGKISGDRVVGTFEADAHKEMGKRDFEMHFFYP